MMKPIISSDTNVTEVIAKRRSWRTYNGQPVADKKREQISDFISSLGKPPFGSCARFELIDLDLKATGKVSGTYGVIKGATTFLASIVEKSPKDMEDIGYLFEKIILFVTAIGMDTCWMGASFSRDLFAEKMKLKPEEVIPVVSPIGYRAGRRSITDAVFHMTAGSKNRKPWPDLFFERSFKTPLDKKNAGKFELPLEMVRLAPSAVNKQPWRLLREGDTVHFFLKRNVGFESMFKMDLQRIDMGIAMCHFELAANEGKIEGKWNYSAPGASLAQNGMEYIVSWECSK